MYFFTTCYRKMGGNGDATLFIALLPVPSCRHLDGSPDKDEEWCPSTARTLASGSASSKSHSVSLHPPWSTEWRLLCTASLAVLLTDLFAGGAQPRCLVSMGFTTLSGGGQRPDAGRAGAIEQVYGPGALKCKRFGSAFLLFCFTRVALSSCWIPISFWAC